MRNGRAGDGDPSPHGGAGGGSGAGVPAGSPQASPRVNASRRCSAARVRSRLAAAGLALAALAVAADAADAAGAAGAMAEATSLRVTGMTFVGSRAGEREIVLRSQVAHFRPESQRAELRDVSALVSDALDGRSFTMTCARVELDIETNDFLAEGDVRGEIGEGQRYAAPWVRYEHERGLLYTDAPVRMEDATGSFRGDGFRYHVDERRFELLGNVRVEQRP